MYRLFEKIHAWIGLIASGFLAIFALSGSILVYRNEIIALSLPKPKSVPILTIEEAISKISLELDASAIKSILTPKPDLPFYKVSHEKAISYFDVSGNLLETSRELQRFDEWLFNLHHYFLMGKTGEPLVGTIGVFCIIMVLIGVYLWLRTWRQFNFRLLPSGIKRREIINHHRNLGIVFALPLLVIAATGTSMIFDDVAKSLISVFTQAKPTKSSKVKIQGNKIELDHITKGMQAAKTAMPDAQIRYIILPKSANEPINFRMKQPDELHPNGRTIVSYDYSKNSVAHVIDAQKLDATSRIYNAAYPLHSGRFGNAVYKFVLLLSGLALFLLSVLSAFSFCRHLTRPRKSLSQ